jgi:hypothetical protein
MALRTHPDVVTAFRPPDARADLTRELGHGSAHTPGSSAMAPRTHPGAVIAPPALCATWICDPPPPRGKGRQLLHLTSWALVVIVQANVTLPMVVRLPRAGMTPTVRAFCRVKQGAAAAPPRRLGARRRRPPMLDPCCCCGRSRIDVQWSTEVVVRLREGAGELLLPVHALRSLRSLSVL